MIAAWLLGPFFVASLECAEPCLECQDSPTSCTECRLPLIVVDNSCVRECPLGTYYTGSSCELCDANCLGCEGSAANCISCKDESFLLEPHCVARCPDDYYVTLDRYCVKCEYPCKTCFDMPNFCSGCEASYSLNNAECVSQCPDSKISYGGVCVNSCPSGTFQNSTQCESCPTQCLECEGDKCTLCPRSKFLYNGSCYDTCPRDITVATNRDCQECDGCDACQGFSTNCIECPQVIYAGNCVDSCPSNTTLQGKVCRDCDSPCLTCEGSITTCKSCQPGFLLSGSSCLQQCPVGQYQSEDACLSCAEHCQICQYSSNNCTSCDEGFILDDTLCVDQCPEGKSQVGPKCVVSGEVCEGCNSAGNNTNTTDDHCEMPQDLSGLKAYFSPSYLSLVVEFPMPINRTASCNELFLSSTLAKLGVSPSCRWNRAHTVVEAKFGRNPTLENEAVLLNMTSVMSGSNCTTAAHTLQAQFIYPHIKPVPNLDYVFQYALTCATDLLFFNAQYSSGGAGRDLSYFWKFDTFVPVGPKPDPTHIQQYNSKNFSTEEGFKFIDPSWASSYRIVVDLTVKNWLQEQTLTQYYATFVFFGEIHPSILEDGSNVVTMKRSETRDFHLSLLFPC
mmetsp:Transcript_17782/g.32123  ORF Transcript_17782/g.32123 Transcript_17782/m.32123 type:complete len:620 (+) Transcript_17782:4061-5920(+)